MFASGSFGGKGEKKLTATGFDMLVLLGMRRWKGRGCGLDLLCDMWSSQLSIFGPASYERKSWGMTGHAPRSRPSADSAQDAHMLPRPQVTGPGPFEPLPTHNNNSAYQPYCGLALREILPLVRRFRAPSAKMMTAAGLGLMDGRIIVLVPA